MVVAGIKAGLVVVVVVVVMEVRLRVVGGEKLMVVFGITAGCGCRRCCWW